MKTIFILIAAFLISYSCTKNDSIGNYEPPVPNTVDTTDWRNQYVDGGVIPTNYDTIGELKGTSWVLYMMNTNYVTTHPNDTIRFLTNTTYTVNNGFVATYNLYSSVGTTNKSLSLYNFIPFGGSQYGGQIGQYSIVAGQINNAVFRDLLNSNMPIIIAWLKKI